MTHWAWGWGGGQWWWGTVPAPQAPSPQGQLDSCGTIPRHKIPIKECAEEAAWQRGCGQGSAWPANASGHKCSTSRGRGHVPSTDRLPTACGSRQDPGAPSSAQRQGAAADGCEEGRGHSSGLEIRALGAPTAGAHPFRASLDKSRGCSTRLSTPPGGRPPYLLPPDTHGRPSVPTSGHVCLPEFLRRGKPYLRVHTLPVL